MKRLYVAAGWARAIALTLGLGAPLFAAQAQQDQAQGGNQGATKLQAVEVTGSRIKKSEKEGRTPIQVITAKEVEASGVATIGDFLQRLGVAGSSLNTKFNSAGNFGFPSDGSGVGSGSSTVSLRELGANRTLVLVDGIRWVNESSASGVSAAVDLNTIPASIIERIEILTDGASSLYGSDAIGGVVNIITKKRQDGGLLHAYWGRYEIGGGETYQGNISLGGSTDKADYFIDLDHFQQQQISSSAWGQSSAAVPFLGPAGGSSATPTGRLVFTQPTATTLCPVDPDSGKPTCNITLNSSAAPVSGKPVVPDDYHQFTDADRFNYAPYNLLLTPSRRTAIFAQGRYNLRDNVRWYLKGLYQSRHSVNQAAPEPIFIGPGAGTGGLADTVGVDASNPYNPFGTLSASAGGNLNFIGRRPLEGGPRVFAQDVDTHYVGTGFEGEFSLFDRLYSWDINYVSGVNSATQTVNGTYNIRHIANALGPVASCTAPCVPLDIFGGPGSINQDMLNYILYTEHDTSKQNLDDFTLNLSGSTFRLPAGTLDFATGFEHRRLQASYTPDSVVTAGESNGVPSTPTSGAYSVDEAYLELAVPILRDLPGAKHLDLSLATRYSSYTTFGDTIKNKFGFRWEPIRELTIRGTFAQGFRAPGVGELFGSLARNDKQLVDPCSGATDPTTVANCKNLGVPAGFVQANTQISVETGGNKNLRPETSKSYTAGVVYSPSWAEHQGWSDKLDFELTFYKHKIDSGIRAGDAQTQLDRCVATGDKNSSFCQGISRSSTGDINQFLNVLVNFGRTDTQGYDFGLNWQSPRYATGRFGVNWSTTYIENFRIISTDTGLADPNAVGVEVNDSSTPRWRSTMRLNWGLRDFSATWALRYISGLNEGCGLADGSPVCTAPHHLHSVLYDDVQVGWTLPVPYKPTISLGVNNLFDANPPVCYSCSLNGYDASTYDLPGRFMYAQAVVKF
jgi:iron complex outermembrane receptor protein